MKLSRRGFLIGTLAATTYRLADGPARVAAANGRPMGPLVVVFLRGGCDSLNLIAPANDLSYRATREAFAIQDSGPHAGIPLKQALVPSLDFRLHPEAKAIHELYVSGHLAIVHAAGLRVGTRSHFVAQEYMARGLSKEGAARDNRGWMARLLSLVQESGEIPAISASEEQSLALVGAPRAMVVPDLERATRLPFGDEGKHVLSQLYERGDTAVARRGRDILRQTAKLDAVLATDREMTPGSANSRSSRYDNSALGRGLAGVSTLIKAEAGLAMAWVDSPGWDTHQDQNGRFSRLVRGLSEQLGVFYNDLAASDRPCTVVVMTEFGRRLRPNHSGGTDHGYGSAMLVMGPSVAGGALLGRWPGLDTEQLDRGVDLAVTTDYRAVLTEVATRHFPQLDRGKLPLLFPNSDWIPGDQLGLWV